MIIPIRCFTCGKEISSKWKIYIEKIITQKEGEVLDEIGFTRYCCRRMFLGHIDLIPKIR